MGQDRLYHSLRLGEDHRFHHSPVSLSFPVIIWKSAADAAAPPVRGVQQVVLSFPFTFSHFCNPGSGSTVHLPARGTQVWDA